MEFSGDSNPIILKRTDKTHLDSFQSYRMTSDGLHKFGLKEKKGTIRI